MNTPLQMAQRYAYQGNQNTLDYELQFLPDSRSEWLRRTNLLVDELRTLQPLSVSRAERKCTSRAAESRTTQGGA